MSKMVAFVGGPADGQMMERPKPNIGTIYIPTSSGGRFPYTLRRCRNEFGDTVEVLAPAGRDIDPTYLKKHKLRN
jgi:hypothetical protein